MKILQLEKMNELHSFHIISDEDSEINKEFQEENNTILK